MSVRERGQSREPHMTQLASGTQIYSHDAISAKKHSFDEAQPRDECFWLQNCLGIRYPSTLEFQASADGVISGASGYPDAFQPPAKQRDWLHN